MIRDMVALLRILARHNATLWEAVAPHVPSGWHVVALQDPIPPSRHVERDLQLEVREAVYELATAALGAAAAGLEGDARKMLQEAGDDWCGNSWPRRWPKPGPRVEAYLTEAPLAAWPVVQAAAALSLGAYAAALADDEIAAMFTEPAERLAKVALSSQR